MTAATDRVVIATRGSRLALDQAELVAQKLRVHHPSLVVETLIVKTTGDRDQRPFAAIGGKGLFTSEVERAIVDGAADIAVHSAKDLTAAIAPGCHIACVPERASPGDVVVGGDGATGEERLGSFPPGARIGTSSMRRRALLAEARGDLEAVELRGNIDTRLAKVRDGVVDAAILAAAGLERLRGLDGADAAPLGADWWIPAPGQGVLAVEALVERDDLTELLTRLEDDTARAELTCERSFARRLEGGCSVPLGCRAAAVEGRLVVTGFLGMPDGSATLRDRISGPLHDAEALGSELAAAILLAGGAEILEDLRYEEPPPIPTP